MMHGPTIAIDVGGTHARFCQVAVEDGVITLRDVVTLPTARYSGLADAWEDYLATLAGPRPAQAAIAVACPVKGDTITLTNNDWTIQPSRLADALRVDRVSLINDFEALGHAVGCAPDADFEHICGPEGPLPPHGTIVVCGPGTGLGVGVLERVGLRQTIRNSEGGHQDFAPVDAFEDGLLADLRTRFGRVSAERVVSGPGIVAIRGRLAGDDPAAAEDADDRVIWRRGISGEDPLSRAAVERFCAALGTFAGNVALDHCADGVVIAGGVAQRIGSFLKHSRFPARFADKGRFSTMLAGIPVKLIVHDQPGLLGVAAAFLREHG